MADGTGTSRQWWAASGGGGLDLWSLGLACVWPGKPYLA
jgi:hypothetical protein